MLNEEQRPRPPCRPSRILVCSKPLFQAVPGKKKNVCTQSFLFLPPRVNVFPFPHIMHTYPKHRIHHPSPIQMPTYPPLPSPPLPSPPLYPALLFLRVCFSYRLVVVVVAACLPCSTLHEDPSRRASPSVGHQVRKMKKKIYRANYK